MQLNMGLCVNVEKPYTNTNAYSVLWRLAALLAQDSVATARAETSQPSDVDFSAITAARLGDAVTSNALRWAAERVPFRSSRSEHIAAYRLLSTIVTRPGPLAGETVLCAGEIPHAPQ